MTTDSTSPPPAPAAPTAKVVRCPSCGAGVTLRALGQSVMVACPACGSQIDVSQPEIRLIKAFQEEERLLRIPLGTRGTLRGQILEVVGAMRRSKGYYSWEEYLLFNPYVGFRWLVYDQGHWNLGQAVKDTSHFISDVAPVYHGRLFRRYAHGEAVVDWVVGEFYWRVAVGDSVDTMDFVEPPFMLCRETAQGEVNWTLLEYVYAAEVAAAFHIKLEQPGSIGANQPSPHVRRLRSILPVMAAAIAAAIVIQVVTVVFAREMALPSAVQTYTYTPGSEEKVFGPISLPAKHSLNELEASADLQNNWAELDCSLVNAETGETFDFTNAFEYYFGSDSDGTWTEGSRVGTSLLASVPGGTYHLVVEGSAGKENNQPFAKPVLITLRHDVAPWRNFWIALGVVFLYPVFLLYRYFDGERQRWSDSDDSDDSPNPFAGEDGGGQ